ncbi:MAG: biopolymer transporter ExbD [Pirellula sp.]|jgi:biopolymer transport protein ExbD|nr:biopolymer transporter ExbD [Pirellula sp.]
MKVPTYRGTRRVSINMTPMIDVTFLLIIFFLVSSHLAKQENFLPLSLPIAASGLSDTPERMIFTVQVTEKGEYRIGSQEVVLDQVRRALQDKNNAEQKPVRVRIRTDRSAPYDSIGALLKIFSVLGNSDVVFAVYEDEQK